MVNSVMLVEDKKDLVKGKIKIIFLTRIVFIQLQSYFKYKQTLEHLTHNKMMKTAPSKFSYLC